MSSDQFLCCPHCGSEVRQETLYCTSCDKRTDDPPKRRGETTFDYVFLHIHHWTGINLFGILLAACSGFGLWGVIEMTLQFQLGDNRHLFVLMLAAVMGSVAALDFFLRKNRVGVYDTNAMFHPSTGGSLWYLPVWAIFTGISICVLLSLFFVQ